VLESGSLDNLIGNAAASVIEISDDEIQWFDVSKGSLHRPGPRHGRCRRIADQIVERTRFQHETLFLALLGLITFVVMRTHAAAFSAPLSGASLISDSNSFSMTWKYTFFCWYVARNRTLAETAIANR